MSTPAPAPERFTDRNAREAEAGWAALDAYLAALGGTARAIDDADLEHQFAQLFASLYHAINRAGLDPHQAHAAAMSNYIAELRGEIDEACEGSFTASGRNITR